MLRLIVFDLSCVNCRLEHLSGTGTMHDGPFDVDNAEFDACGDTCFVCTGDWKKLFCAVHKVTAVRWLDSGPIRDTFPIVGKTDDIGDFCNQLIRLVWDHPKTIEALFDLKKSSITKGVVCCFFLELIAANILSIDVTSRDVVKWCISRQLRWFDSSSGEPTSPPCPQCNSTTPPRSNTPPCSNTPPRNTASRRMGNKVSRYI